ncbi:hypothetical protein DFS34DRAFT_698492 [Phlyctochytrium arcticum]|nr:hypothetical protein DFS34DRAFT_698492 [Phlyctochytrium arcticum]
MTTIWFQLTTANGKRVATVTSVSVSETSNVDNLRDAVKGKCANDLEKVDANQLLVYASKSELDDDIAANKTLTGLKPGKKVDTLGDTDDDHPILIVVPERGQATTSATWHDLFTQHNDINVDGFYLPRIKLRDQLLSKLQRNQIVVISSPAGSGKTSLSRLFEANIRNVICASLLRSDFAQFIDRLRTGSIIDRHAKTHLLNNKTRCIVWLDDAQATYDQHSHWAELVKDVIPLFGCTNFILSATHLLETRNESPPALRSLPRIKWGDFQISYKEALDLLQAPSPFGLPKNWQTDLLEQVLIRECNGLIAALRVSIDALVDSVAERMTRCFGEKQSTPVDRNLKTFLESCLLQTGRILQVASLDEEAKRHLRWLTKSGILSDTGQDETAVEIKFSSPLAKRFYTRTSLLPIPPILSKDDEEVNVEDNVEDDPEAEEEEDEDQVDDEEEDDEEEGGEVDDEEEDGEVDDEQDRVPNDLIPHGNEPDEEEEDEEEQEEEKDQEEEEEEEEAPVRRSLRQNRPGFYEVDYIVDKRRRGHRVEYRVRWKGYDASADTYEPLSNLLEVMDLVEEFEDGARSSIYYREYLYNSTTR